MGWVEWGEWVLRKGIWLGRTEGLGFMFVVRFLWRGFGGIVRGFVCRELVGFCSEGVWTCV